jgi:HPt (histidine-containing phosphotransfer) domain-containing protein
VSAAYAGSGPVDAVRAQLAELCGSDDEQDWAMLGTVLDAFSEGSAGRLDELVGAVRSASVPQVEFLAHRLRGSALTLGLDALAHVCGRLEADAREGLVDGSGQLVRALVRELEAAVDAVEHVRAALPADSAVPVASNGW